MEPTALFADLECNLVALEPTLLILDNLADIFGGNENVKGLVRQFVGMLRGLAIKYDLTVLVLAHPSLSGMSSGTGSSGNVAWNNSVRSRLYLKRQHDVAAEITDPYFRRLVTMKANYAPLGGEIGMRWERGRFVATERPAAATGTVDRWRSRRRPSASSSSLCTALSRPGATSVRRAAQDRAREGASHLDGGCRG